MATSPPYSDTQVLWKSDICRLQVSWMGKNLKLFYTYSRVETTKTNLTKFDSHALLFL